MTTVELFAGIGGFRSASDACGLTTVWANDHDPKACRVYRSVFGGDELREGDIRPIIQDIPCHDVLTAGFPCQPFSNAGKKNGIRDPRGTLFEEIVRVLAKCQPKYFVLENVKRLLSMEDGRHFATILDSLSALNYEIEWRLLNAMDFGLPQNRQRVFIAGVRRDVARSRQDESSAFASAADLAELPDRQLRRIDDHESWPRIDRRRQSFPHWGLARDHRFFGATLSTFSTGTRPPTLRSVIQKRVEPEFDFTDSTLARLKDSTTVRRFVDGVEILSNQGGGARMGYTVFGINGVAPTLTASTSRHYERYQIRDRFRRLTNIEYARIQGFPDQHCDAISVYDQYVLFGNAVPPPMAHWAIQQTLSPFTLEGLVSEDLQLSLPVAAS